MVRQEKALIAGARTSPPPLLDTIAARVRRAIREVGSTPWLVIELETRVLDQPDVKGQTVPIMRKALVFQPEAEGV